MSSPLFLLPDGGSGLPSLLISDVVVAVLAQDGVGKFTLTLVTSKGTFDIPYTNDNAIYLHNLGLMHLAVPVEPPAPYAPNITPPPAPT